MISLFNENLVHLHSLFEQKNKKQNKQCFIYWVENPNFLKSNKILKIPASDNRHYTTQTLKFNIPLIPKNKTSNII